MHLTRLALTNFRNYAHLELDLAPGVTLLQGNNACGKTSLLEAIFYLATAHSPHAGAERELIRWGASDEPIPFARVETEVAKRNDTRAQLEIVLVQAAEEKSRGENEEARKANRGHQNSSNSPHPPVSGSEVTIEECLDGKYTKKNKFCHYDILLSRWALEFSCN